MYIIDERLNATKIDENVNPLTKEYSKNDILAVIGFISITFADKKNTITSSTMIKIQYALP